MRRVSGPCLGWGGLMVADAPEPWTRNRLVKQGREARFLNETFALRAGSSPARDTNDGYEVFLLQLCLIHRVGMLPLFLIT